MAVCASHLSCNTPPAAAAAPATARLRFPASASRGHTVLAARAPSGRSLRPPAPRKPRDLAHSRPTCARPGAAGCAGCSVTRLLAPSSPRSMWNARRVRPGHACTMQVSSAVASPGSAQLMRCLPPPSPAAGTHSQGSASSRSRGSCCSRACCAPLPLLRQCAANLICASTSLCDVPRCQVRVAGGGWVVQRQALAPARRLANEA